jgi:hypothetical protein
MSIEYHDKDFWSDENQQYSDPQHRLQNCLLMVNRLAVTTDCDLVDVG